MKAKIPALADKTAHAIQQAKAQIGEIAFLANTLGERIQKLDAALSDIQSIGLFSQDANLLAAIQSMRDEAENIRRLRNQMELGGLAISGKNILDIAWGKLP